MGGQSGAIGSAGQHEPVHKRPTIALAIPVLIILVSIATYLLEGIVALFDLGVFGEASVPPLFADGGVTDAGKELIICGFDLAVGAAFTLVLIGFLRRRKWAWVAVMTWVAISLTINLVRYIQGDPHYPRMLVAVVLMLVLNLASVHRAFGMGGR
jgi:hypothetical protein